MKKNLLFLVFALVVGAFAFTGCATQSGGVGGGAAGDSGRSSRAGVQEHGIIYNSATDQSLGEDGDEERIYDVFFDYDSYVLEGEARKIIENNARILRMNKGARVSVEGHCDNRGSDEYNIALGERRTQSVKKYLVRVGVSEKSISTVSYGEEKPFCKGSGSDCLQKNRRVHFVVKY